MTFFIVAEQFDFVLKLQLNLKPEVPLHIRLSEKFKPARLSYRP